MSKATWEDLGTIIEAQKRKAEAGEKAAQQLKVTNDILTQELMALREKHRNLKESERKRRRGEVSKVYDLNKE